MAGNVNLIDPNSVNINNEIVNGIPQYQDMFISVDLIGVRRGRTVLATNIDTKTTRIERTGLESDISVNFLGPNQDPSNPAHYNQFTTNWYDGAADKDKTYEGFGITNIDIVVNSSFIPQVNIEFVDIRGLAFFNRENSPYRILFDFPPPIFELTVKGYYGKATTYKLHLVKYNTSFKPETGNYHITGEFIGLTYAPLTDILFRYIVQAPLMSKDKSATLSSEPGVEPKNTFDLLLKLENLYSTIPDKIKTDSDNLRYENAQESLSKYSSVLEMLYSFKTNEILQKNGGIPIIITFDETPGSDTYGEKRILKTFSEYDQYLKSFKTSDLSSSIYKRLFIGYQVKGESILSTDASERNNVLKEQLNKFRYELLNKSKSIIYSIKDSDIDTAENKFDNLGANAYNEARDVKFVGIDVADYYVKIYKAKADLDVEKTDAMSTLNVKINNMIQTRLGMMPTIYNIFKIILNDVDEFFDVLRDTSRLAEEHHEDYASLILNDGSYKDVEDKIYPFPLVVKQKTICNQVKEERVAPVDLSERLGLDRPFPELSLVQDFIDSFISYQRVYEQATMKEDTDSNGDYKWIPVSPVDSVLANPNISSPYFGKDSPGGGSNFQPIDTSETNKVASIFEIALKRFYVLTQNVMAYSFYDANTEDTKGSYIDLFAKSEALNLANSITNEQYANLILTVSKDNNSQDKINNFYTYLNNNLKELYTNNDSLYITMPNGMDVYRDKDNSKFEGLAFVNAAIDERTGADNDVIGEFIETNKFKFIDLKKRKEGTFSFTKENVIYRKDVNDSTKLTRKGKDSSIVTKFLAPPINLIVRNDDKGIITFNDPVEASTSEKFKYTYVGTAYETAGDEYNKKNFPEFINNLANKGNSYFYDSGLRYWEKLTVDNLYHVNYVDTMSSSLAAYGDSVYNIAINYKGDGFDDELSAILFLSAFGSVLSPFNDYPYGLNKGYFSNASIIEMPTFVKLYVGALVGIEKDDDLWNRLYSFFMTGGGKIVNNAGAYIFADIHDINNYLSSNDKDRFRLEYDKWKTNSFENYINKILSLYEKVNIDAINSCGADSFKCKFNLYQDLLTPESAYSSIITELMRRIPLACYSEITFNNSSTIEPTTYDSLSETNLTESKKNLNNRYWYKFFSELSVRIEDRLNSLEEQTRDFKNSTGDEDIVNQTYYSFKNINDKWLSGLDNGKPGEKLGYPFKKERNSKLISQFAFVDRAMNPIGDTIIDPQAILDAKDNPETSIFTVISQLLSLNGFEFFPLQNFMDFENHEWVDSFKIDNGYIDKEYPVFVCMYLGGTSSYPTGIGSRGEFKDDGIIDLENPGISDFNAGNCPPDPDKDDQENTLIEDANMLNKVRAFKVRYGEQNQNMFYGFDIDSKEYSETNESIQILSQLAGDNKQQAPVPKAQNLYSIYENRAYKASITGLGNVMIQPTQYFQLENVPLFNGAYVILSVEHNIVPNKMTTKFTGTKILKYPIPRVLNPASILGYDGGSTVNSDPNILKSSKETGGEVTLGVGSAGNPDQAKYNSMYSLDIG